MATGREISAGTLSLPGDLAEPGRPSALRRAFRAWLHKPLGVIGLSIIVVLVVLAVGAPAVERYDPDTPFQVLNPNYNANSQGSFFSNDRDQYLPLQKADPSASHWLGTDDGARDIWSRVVWGLRRSMTISVAALALAAAAGALIGLASGYFGGAFDTSFQRLIDAFQAFPPLLVLILGATVFEVSIRNLILEFAIIGTPQVSRIVRGSVLSVREMPFIEAGRVIGASHWRLMFRHILPNTWAAIIVVFTIGIGAVIVAEASLAFLGLAPPGYSLGFMLSSGVGFINESPWQAVFAGGAITLAVLGFNLMGDALRDILDPRLRI